MTALLADLLEVSRRLAETQEATVWQLEERNELIHQAREAGHTLAAIASAAGMTRARVHQIVKGA